ncbi:MAG: sigma-70 family RNA polymerase sigma factor [Bacteroidota bacterium]|nr:sigma-70 family RNA polymerase sigma factor [Bacteroidota bacterium]
MDLTKKADVAILIDNCIRGDRKSQQTLYKEFYGKMLVVCMRYASDKNEAKDILHDGFIKVFNKLKSFKNEGSLEGWIRRIMVNNSIDHVRRKREILFAEGDDFTIEKAIKESETDDSELFLKEKAEIILSLIQKLSPAYRTVFNMYVIENYKHKEIAEHLNINIGTSKSNYAKAKMKLRLFYNEYIEKHDQQ